MPCIYIRRKEIFFIFFFTMCTNHYTNSTLRLNGILGESQILNFLYDYLVIRTMTNEYFIKLPKFPLEGIINMCFLDKCGQPYVNDRHMWGVKLHNTCTLTFCEMGYESAFSRKKQWTRCYKPNYCCQIFSKYKNKNKNTVTGKNVEAPK